MFRRRPLRVVAGLPRPLHSGAGETWRAGVLYPAPARSAREDF